MTELNTFDYTTITFVIITIISISCSCYNPSISDCYSISGGRGSCKNGYELFSFLSSFMILITSAMVFISINNRNPNLATVIALVPIILSVFSSFSSRRR
jgi:hypothetical protein